MTTKSKTESAGSQHNLLPYQPRLTKECKGQFYKGVYAAYQGAMPFSERDLSAQVKALTSAALKAKEERLKITDQEQASG